MSPKVLKSLSIAIYKHIDLSCRWQNRTVWSRCVCLTKLNGCTLSQTEPMNNDELWTTLLHLQSQYVSFESHSSGCRINSNGVPICSTLYSLNGHILIRSICTSIGSATVASAIYCPQTVLSRNKEYGKGHRQAFGMMFHRLHYVYRNRNWMTRACVLDNWMQTKSTYTRI